jgi:hypothetical protein
MVLDCENKLDEVINITKNKIFLII